MFGDGSGGEGNQEKIAECHKQAGELQIVCLVCQNAGNNILRQEQSPIQLDNRIAAQIHTFHNQRYQPAAPAFAILGK